MFSIGRKHSLEEGEEVSKEATKEINHDDLEDESQFTSLNRSLWCAIFDEMVVYDLEDELEITSLSTSLRCTIFEEMVVENQLATKSIVHPRPPLRSNFYFQIIIIIWV